MKDIVVEAGQQRPKATATPTKAGAVIFVLFMISLGFYAKNQLDVIGQTERYVESDAMKAHKQSQQRVGAAPGLGATTNRLAEYRSFVEHMSAHQSSQCRKMVSGSTGTLLQLATEVSENSELLYNSTLKWARDGDCVR